MDQPVIRNNIKNAFYSRWGRYPTDEQIDDIIRENIKRRQPQKPDTPSMTEQLLYGIGGTGLAKLAGAYGSRLGDDIAEKGFYDTLFGNTAEDQITQLLTNDPNDLSTDISTNFFAQLYDDSMLEHAVQAVYKGSIVDDLITSLFA